MASARTVPPFRAEHIGSFRRPADLLQKRADFKQGICTAEELHAAEDEAIRRFVALQKAAGIRSITDGELRRELFLDGIFDQVDGMVAFTELPQDHFMQYIPTNRIKTMRHTAYICKGKLKRTKSLYKREFEGLKQFVSPEEVKYIKLTMCQPEWLHMRHGPYAYDKNVYASDEEYFADIAQIYREEIQDLYSLGCRNIQIDDPTMSFFCDQSVLSGMKKAGVDADALLDVYIRLLNDCIRDRPVDMVAGIHLCRGNTPTGFSSGAYDRIAVKLFNETAVNCFYLEYDTERAGGFEPLKFLPKDKLVVLGLVSTRTIQLEDISELRKRIDQAAEFISQGEPKRSKEEALNQICISPQCGFSSGVRARHPLMEEDIKKKLELLVETAELVWH